MTHISPTANAQDVTAKHTPGPWITDGDQVTPENEDANDGFLIARTFGSETIANARLIAAAPELLRSLEAFVAEYVALVESGDAGFWNAETETKVIDARAAIAKATAA